MGDVTKQQWGSLFLVIFVGFALGITLAGVGSLRTTTLPRAVGGFLLLFAASWFVLLVVGAENPVWIDFGTTSVHTMALLAIGYLLRGEPTRDRPEPSPTEAHHD